MFPRDACSQGSRRELGPVCERFEAEVRRRPCFLPFGCFLLFSDVIEMGGFPAASSLCPFPECVEAAAVQEVAAFCIPGLRGVVVASCSCCIPLQWQFRCGSSPGASVLCCSGSRSWGPSLEVPSSALTTILKSSNSLS